MCRHVAAVLYGIGARLDHRPELLFTLRRVAHEELIAKAGARLFGVGDGDGRHEGARGRAPRIRATKRCSILALKRMIAKQLKARRAEIQDRTP